MEHFLSVDSTNNINELIKLALELKQDPLKYKGIGADRTLGMLFLNPSLRTRISTEIAARNLGLRTIILNADKDAWNLEFNIGSIMNGKTVEHIIEAAGVLGQYFDILGVRSFPLLKNKEEDYAENILNQFKQYSNLPIVNMESATVHPLQSLADLVTIKELWRGKRKPKIVMSWAPHVKALPQSVPNSFAQWITKWNEIDFIVTHPQGYELDENITGKLNIEYNQDKALKDADFIYVKNWSSTKHYGEIINTDLNWTINQKKISSCPNANVMHCLPVRRNLVIADDILNSSNSIVLQQAKNRICATQAVLYELLK